MTPSVVITRCLTVACLAIALSAASFCVGNNYGRDAQRRDDLESSSSVDAVVEVLSDWFTQGDRSALLDLRRDAIVFLSGRDVFVLNAMISEDPIYNSCTISPLYPESEGGMISGNVFSNLEVTSSRYREGALP